MTLFQFSLALQVSLILHESLYILLLSFHLILYLLQRLRLLRPPWHTWFHAPHHLTQEFVSRATVSIFLFLIVYFLDRLGYPSSRCPCVLLKEHSSTIVGSSWLASMLVIFFAVGFLALFLYDRVAVVGFHFIVSAIAETIFSFCTLVHCLARVSFLGKRQGLRRGRYIFRIVDLRPLILVALL